MEKDPLTDQLWQLYKKIPKELQEAIFSMETADSVFNICEKNDINEVHELAKIIGDSLLGILPPKEIQKTLEENLKLSPEKAKKVALEIDRFIFYPLKDSLTQLYGEDMKGLEGTEETKETKKETKKKKERKREKRTGNDSYREPVE